MEYPKTNFTKNKRLAMLIIFIAAFFTISPLLIIHTMGYRFDMAQKKLKEVGALSVDIIPKTGDIYLNDTLLPKNTFDKKIELKNIQPGKYRLSIKTPNYYDWKKDIEIDNKKTVYIKETNLIKNAQPQLFLDKNIGYFSFSADFAYLVYTTTTDKETTFWLWNKKTTETSLLFKTNYINNPSISWSKKHNCALAHQIGQYDNLQIFCLQNDVIKKIPWTNSTKTIDKILWKDSDEPEIFYGTNQGIFSFNLQNVKDQFITDNNHLDWYISDNRLWTLEFNTSTKKYEVTKDILGFTAKFGDVPANSENLDVKNAKYQMRLALISNDNVLLTNQSRSEMTIVNKDKTYTISGKKFVVSPYSNWWIIWTPWELWTYIEGDKPELQNRSSENLQTVVPLDQYNALGMIWEKKVTVLFPYYLVVNELPNLKIKEITADSKNRVLYFTLQDKQGIWKLEY